MRSVLDRTALIFMWLVPEETPMSALRTDDARYDRPRPHAGTQKSYLRAVTDLAQFAHRRPDQLSDRDVQRYMVHLLEERHLAWSTCNTIVHGLRFFYHVALGHPKTTFHIPCARQPSKLPVILSRAEVAQLLAAASPCGLGPSQTTYSAGLRVSEVLRLKLTDIDSQRMCLRIEQGKRRKDRYVPLSARLLPDLRTYGGSIGRWCGCFPTTHGHPALIGDSPSHFPRGESARGWPTQGIHSLRHALCHPSVGSRHGPPCHPTAVEP